MRFFRVPNNSSLIIVAVKTIFQINYNYIIDFMVFRLKPVSDFFQSFCKGAIFRAAHPLSPIVSKNHISVIPMGIQLQCPDPDIQLIEHTHFLVGIQVA